MKSKKNLMLLWAFCTCLVLAGVAMAFTVSVADTDLDADGNAIIRVVRQDGEPLTTAAYEVSGAWVVNEVSDPLDGDGEALIPLAVGSWNMVLSAIDTDLVTLNVIDSAVEYEPTVYEFVVAPVQAEIDISPSSLNLDSNGNTINCKVQLPDEYPVEDIIIGSIEVTVEGEATREVEIDGVIEEVTEPYFIDGIGISSVQVKRRYIKLKIDRSDLTNPLKALGENDSAEVTVSGELVGGLYFEGAQTLRIINNTQDETARGRTRTRTNNGRGHEE